MGAFKQNAGSPDCKLLSDNIKYELTRINELLALNKLNLNINKTKYIIFHFPQRNMAFFNLEHELCGQFIERVRQFVFLGITKTYPGADIGSDHNPVVATVKINLKRIKKKENMEQFNLDMLKDEHNEAAIRS